MGKTLKLLQPAPTGKLSRFALAPFNFWNSIFLPYKNTNMKKILLTILGITLIAAGAFTAGFYTDEYRIEKQNPNPYYVVLPSDIDIVAGDHLIATSVVRGWNKGWTEQPVDTITFKWSNDRNDLRPYVELQIEEPPMKGNKLQVLSTSYNKGVLDTVWIGYFH